jgi:holo-[acyl-carrier protein] synthase
MSATGVLRVGIDLVQISRIADSVTQFGARFLDRVFTAEEQTYALAAPALTAERLASRFAAKEATIKALDLVEESRQWRDIEVCRSDSGATYLSLHGRARERARLIGADALALSLSHEGDYATAVVVTTALASPPR